MQAVTATVYEKRKGGKKRETHRTEAYKKQTSLFKKYEGERLLLKKSEKEKKKKHRKQQQIRGTAPQKKKKKKKRSLNARKRKPIYENPTKT